MHTRAEVTTALNITARAFFALPANLPAFQEVTYVVPSNAGGGDPQNSRSLVGRVDFNLSDKTSLYGRYAPGKPEFLQCE